MNATSGEVLDASVIVELVLGAEAGVRDRRLAGAVGVAATIDVI